MVFWRSKPAKAAENSDDKIVVATETPDRTASGDDSDTESNVVPLVAQKLTERLAEAADEAISTDNSDAMRRIEERDLRRAINQAKPGKHIIALGPAGSASRDQVRQLAEVRAQTLEAAPDWLYVLDPDHAGRLLCYSVPHGEALRFTRDVGAALEKATAIFQRLIGGEEYRLSFDLIEEDARYRTDTLLDGIRRRAENQNIAVIKSLDGYMLAPMHEGRVVRQDVFRSLPEGLRREVEGKIKDLEKDLQSVVAALPESEVEADDKLTSLIEQTAMRALKPNLSVVRKMYSATKDLAPVFEKLEQLFVRRAASAARHTGSPYFVPAFCWTGSGVGTGDSGDGAPVAILRGSSIEDLCGEVGRDASGALAVRPGELTSANGGIVVVEAWRLAADPRAWADLSSILQRNSLIPRSGSGIAVSAQPIPLSLTLILVADPQSLARLEEIDPGLSQYFSVISKFETVTAGQQRDEAAS